MATVDQPGQKQRVPRLERLDLLREVAGVAGLVGGLDVHEEQVGTGLEGGERGIALALVVGVEPASGAWDLDRLDPGEHAQPADQVDSGDQPGGAAVLLGERSEEHTSELQSLMRISYAVFCLKKKRRTTATNQ